ncbi:MAG: hypothetical protein QXL86_03575 [Candidatus Aenigmatarchaeota archaeon]
MMKGLFSLLIFLLFFVEVGKAIPILIEPIPANGSYIYGKDYEIFSIKVVGSLNESTAKLNARVEDPTSTWKSIVMSCILVSQSTWQCNATIPGLEALVHDGNWLLYYFDAYDLEGNYGNLGNSSYPLRVRVDRSAPNISFIVPQNQSYYSDKVEIKIEAQDSYSGINPSSVKYSFDNSTWLDMRALDEKTFVSSQKWDTKVYQNNQSVFIFGKATDMVGNSVYTKIQVFIDNELPSFSVLNLEANQTIFGVHTFEIEFSDTYSGIDFARVRISNHLEQFFCSGTPNEANCRAEFDSKWVVDGKHEAIFEVFDKAGNSANLSLPVVIDNLPPTIIILYPSQGSSLSGEVNISAQIRDDGTGIKISQFRIESDGAIVQSWRSMSCISNTCSAIWNSSEVVNGNYLIRIYGEDMLGRNSSLTSYISVVNTRPIQTTSTTIISNEEEMEKTEKKENQKPSIFPVSTSNIFDKMKKNPILVAAFFLPLLALPFLFLFSRIKPEKKEKINVEEIFERLFAELEEIRNFTQESLKTSDLTQLKDRIRLIMIRIGKIEKDPLKKTIDLILASGEEKIGIALNDFLKEKKEEIEILKTQKEEYLQEISKLLSDALSEESIDNIRKDMDAINILIRKLKGLIQREIDILSEGLTEIGYLK